MAYETVREQFHARVQEGDALGLVRCLAVLYGAGLESEAFRLVDEDKDDEYGRPALNNAVAFGHTDVVRTLLDMAVRQRPDDEEGNYPIHEASMNDDLNLIQVLLRNGADVNAKNHRGITPLYHAVQAKRRDIIQVLMESSADPFACADNGEAPIWLTDDPDILAAMGHKKCECDECQQGNACAFDRFVVPMDTVLECE